ncbi:TIGR03067 domain-containing protein [Tundrisphaera lichenicola]|uniref:TIGR03067 domain-containing protein n=1 Tax=Tundrisphaera lichenicola TaxID=2029860 RepID=UPI003EB89FF3
MISTLVVVLLAGLPLADGPAEELGRFQGRWKLVREHIAKKDTQGVDGEWLIEGDKLTETRRFTGRGKLTLDPSTKPARFEMTFAADPKLRGRGIYRFEGDKFLTYIQLRPPTPEPTDFPEGPDRRYLVEIWKRTGGPVGEVIDGEWELLERVQGEQRTKLKNHLMKVVEGEWTKDYKSVTHYSIRLNPTATLKHLDLKIFDTDSPVSRTFLDVYSLDGDRLTVWGEDLSSASGNPVRRDSVSEAPDSDNYFRVYERVKPSPPVGPDTPE